MILICIGISNHSNAQNSDEILQDIQRYRDNGTLDSQYVKINCFKDQFGRIERKRWFYTHTDTIADTTGGKWIGNIILDPYLDYNGIRVGQWTEYYPNDSIKSRGTFSIGATTYCQAAGPSVSGYEYKSGVWTFYYDSEQVRARGEFKREKEEFRNSCGGDAYFYGMVTAKWLFYNEEGDFIDKPSDISEFEDY